MKRANVFALLMAIALLSAFACGGDHPYRIVSKVPASNFVVMETSMGVLTIELYPDKAPVTGRESSGNSPTAPCARSSRPSR